MMAAKHSTLQALEMHGTGTSLGDPIEMGAACAVIGQVEPHICLHHFTKANTLSAAWDAMM